MTSKFYHHLDHPSHYNHVQVLRGVQGGEGHEDLQAQQGDRETGPR